MTVDDDLYEHIANTWESRERQKKKPKDEGFMNILKSKSSSLILSTVTAQKKQNSIRY